MSQEHHPAQFGYRLVEILVAIGIVAVLVGIIITPGTNHLWVARHTKTAALCNQIQTAVLNYYTDYGIYPVPQGTGKVDTYYSRDDVAGWAAMTIALYGMQDPIHPTGKVDPIIATIPNDRQTCYLSVSRSDLDMSSGSGIVKQPFKDNDGKAQFFYLAIDSNYDNSLGDKDQPAGKLPDFVNGHLGGAVISTGVAAWSNCDRDPNDPKKLNFWVYTY